MSQVVPPEPRQMEAARIGGVLPWYALTVLTLVAAISLMDRVAIGIVQEPVKQAFRLSDFQLGLVGGPAFAILNALLGLPIASYTERWNRVSVVALSMSAWSLATACCGLASSYALLVLSRLGVSIGEAGSTPQSQSIIVDYFPAGARATALAILALSTPIAALSAGFLGGWLAQSIGWRMMFVALGAGGLIFAGLIKATLPDAPRRAHPQTARPRVGPALLTLFGVPPFFFLVLGSALSCFVGYGLSQYLVSFLMRCHGLSLLQASQFNGLMFGVFAGLGTFGCGWLVDRLRGRWPRVGYWLPAVGMLGAIPFYLVGYTAPSLALAGPALMTGAFLNYFYVGSIFAVLLTLAPPHLRTISTAAVILVWNLIGYGLGPPVMGLLSDLFQAQALAHAGADPHSCIGATVTGVCTAAKASGLRLAIVISLLGYLGAGLCFVRSVFTAPRPEAPAVRA